MWSGDHDRTKRDRLTDAEASAAREVLFEIMQGSIDYAGKWGTEGATLLFGACPATLHKALCGLEVSTVTASAIRKGLRRVDRIPVPVTP